MPAFNQQTLNYAVRNGNAVVVMIGDMELGFGQTTTLSDSMGSEQLYGIGSAKPQEIQQLKFSPSLTLDYLQLSESGLAFLGYPSTLAGVLSNNEFNISINDADGLPIYQYVGCVASDYNSNISANQPITDSISFLAMDILDPLGVSILNSNSALNVVTSLAGALNIAGI